MANKKTIWLSTVVLVLLLAAIAIIVFTFSKRGNQPNLADGDINNSNNASSTSEQNSTTSQEYYTNKDGAQWTISDKADFTVSSSRDAEIKFWEGQINPLKVHPGQTQNMRIVVSSESGIKSLTAEIETDNGINKVELKKTGTVAAKDLNINIGRYAVDDNNELALLSDSEALAYLNSLDKKSPNSFLASNVSAAAGEKEVWEASWLVKDTSVREYITTFIARDGAGHENRMVLAWSDPCTNAAGQNWTGTGSSTLGVDCTLTSTYGVEQGNISIATGTTMTLSPGSNFVFNPGNKITFDGGQILLSGGSIRKTFLWAYDYDVDGYAPTDGRQYGDSNPGSGWRRQLGLASSTNDCYDSNSNAHPGQTTYYSTNRGDGSFDYDCSQTTEISTYIARCVEAPTYIDPPKLFERWIYEFNDSLYGPVHCSANVDCEDVGSTGDLCVSGGICVFKAITNYQTCLSVYLTSADCGTTVNVVKRMPGYPGDTGFHLCDDNICEGVYYPTPIYDKSETIKCR